MKFFSFLLVGLLVAIGSLAGDAISLDKKVIQVGWGVPYTAHVRQNIRAMEEAPFDGLALRMKPNGGAQPLGHEIFQNVPLKRENYSEAEANLKATEFRRFTDNFLWCETSMTRVQQIDAFDDAAWRTIALNGKLAAGICRDRGLKGFWLDVEEYKGARLFKYPSYTERPDKSFTDYQVKMRERGRQWMAAVCEAYPGITVLLTHAHSAVRERMEWRGTPYSLPWSHRYALSAAFIDGMLEGADEQAAVHDGFERSYGFVTDEHFRMARRQIVEEGIKVSRVPDLYRRRMKAAFALWLDYEPNMLGWNAAENVDRNPRSPGIFERALHNALTHADKYVWVYSEKADWWGTSPHFDRPHEAYMRALENAKKAHPASWTPPGHQDPVVPPPAATDPGYDEQAVFGHLWEAFEPLTDLPGTWLFMPDPFSMHLGHMSSFSALGLRDMDWQPIRIGEWWERQGYAYDGWAWYRLQYHVPADWGDRDLYLAFGGVKDNLTAVSVNGETVLNWIDKEANKGFLLSRSISEYVKFGEVNLITARVNNKQGPGGIYRPVKLIARRPTADGMIKPPRQKKLIQYGWGVPDTKALLENIREMEKEPFDGIAFRILARMPDGRRTPRGFSKEKFEESWFSEGYENLRKVKFEKFTDNFVDLQASPGDMDWFNDKHWETACHNVGLFVKAATIAGCKGLKFDPELYVPGDKLWAPNALKANPALYDTYALQARIRGKQFIETIGRKMPDAVILCLHLLSSIDPAVLEADDPRTKLVEDNYGLLPAFLNGMLDGIKPGMKIVDGNEMSYYYREESDYYRGYHRMRQDVLRLIAPENVHKYQTQVSAGHAMYLLERFSSTRPPAEEARQFENMITHALTASDEYVWVYNERWMWWPEGKRRLPHGIQAAILNAKDRVAGVAPDKLRDLSQKAGDERQGRREAVVPGLAAGIAPPKLDGDLTDPAWNGAMYIKDFQALTSGPPAARTQAWVTFDRENLYIAFRCAEPSMATIESVGKHHDDPVWRGDSFDIFISTGPTPWSYYHYIVNPGNVHWDEFRNDGKVVDAFDGQWQSAVKKTADAWQGELALPWRDMGMTAPAAGAELCANLCRNRKAGGLRKDYSSWTRIVRQFQEPGRFGYWVFNPSSSTP